VIASNTPINPPTTAPFRRDELKIRADPILDLANQGIRLEGLEVLANGQTDLVVVAA